ncbi:MAG: cyoD 2 [Parcubacteria group bacterium]|nr:cyoD 2 [Parcubacteria group bacterium]
MNTRTYFEDVGAWPAAEGKPHLVWPAYVLGFILSLLLTFAAYGVVVYHVLPVSLTYVIAVLIGLAGIQFLVQLVFFFHLSAQHAARERLIILGGTIIIVGILLSGSIWIMFTLDQRMMPSATQMTHYMDTQAGI